MKTKKGDVGVYEFEGGRVRKAFVFRAYSKNYPVLKKIKAFEEVEEEDAETGKIKRTKVEHEVEKHVDSFVELVDVLVLLESEDERRGATRPQVLSGYIPLEGVQLGEGTDRFNPGA